MMFSIKDVFSTCDQIRIFLQIWSYLLKLMEDFIFCVVCYSWNATVLCWRQKDKNFIVSFFKMLSNEMETLKLMKQLSKTIIAINWFNGVVQAGIIVAEHINEWKGIKQMSYYMYHKTPEHALTLIRLDFLWNKEMSKNPKNWWKQLILKKTTFISSEQLNEFQ